MDAEQIAHLLEDYKIGRIDSASAIERLRRLPFEDLGFAKVDHHRALRGDFPEVVYCPGKTPEHIKGIIKSLLAENPRGLLATRASREAFDAVHEVADDAVYHEAAKLVTIHRRSSETTPKKSLLVVSAGTADLPVAEEAAITADMLGCTVKRVYDVGVAGLHRLLSQMDALSGAGVIIVVAGMEGALASVIGGLVRCPVIAVPTSTGYGASFGGLAALLAMLNSCAAGVAVCNIDNGFGAAWMANRILRVNE